MDNQKLVIFTDLDGTLLDHETYRYDEAADALDLLRQRKIPLVLASSKTAAEIAPLREELGFAHCPAIVENGAGLLAAGSYAENTVSKYQQLIAALDNVAEDLRTYFRGFNQMTINEISDITGLDTKAAARAKDRHYSEPGIWSGSDEDLSTFLPGLHKLGVSAKRGGRFLTLSFGGDKAVQVKHIIEQFSGDGRSPVSLALGDAPNDIEMLNATDFGVIVKNDTHDGIPVQAGEKMGRISRTDLAGSTGWNKAVLAFVENHMKKETSNG